MSALSSPVEIANLALVGYLGKSSISSFTQTSIEAVRASIFYPMARDEVAQASNWSFLRERATLALVPNDQPEAWLYSYDYPSRALKFMYLCEPRFPLRPWKEYEIVGQRIYTHLSEAQALYVTLQTTGEVDWPLHFKKAIAAKLAELMAPGFTRRPSDVDAMRTMAGQELARAIENDASTEHTTYTEDESYVYGVEGQRASPPTYDRSTFWRR
jgi:hypothetical protein